MSATLKDPQYEKQKARSLDYGLRKSLKGRDIGTPPAVSDPELRELVANDLEQFLLRLFPKIFKWPFSEDQRLSIQQMDGVIDRGGLQAVADPRGTGKTQRAIRAALKAVLTGKRKYVCIVAATDKAARRIIKALKTIVCYNRLLYRLFPNELHGFPQLQGDNRKAPGQLINGQKTHISLKTDEIVFPQIPGSACAGAIISSCGITGNVRGQFHTPPGLDDGESEVINVDSESEDVIRPDLVIVDDPQTKESARSQGQTQERLEIIEGDVLGLSGPDTAIACMVLCTVIEKDDLSERLLNEAKWHGRRTKTIYKFPSDMKAWDAYFEDYEEAIRIGEPERINQAYEAQRDQLDAGCELAWSERKESGDVSAIQTAMHIWHRCGPIAFASEYQNTPLVESNESSKPSTSAIVSKLIGLQRGIVPKWATKLTAAVDCQMTCLFWMVVAWSDDFTGHIVDYGVTPEQPRNYFTLRDVAPTLQAVSGSSQPEGALRHGLDMVAEKIIGKAWQHEDGGQMRVSKMLVDAGYKPDTVHEFALRSPYAANVLPCLGLGITAAKVPMEKWPSRSNEKMGWHWVEKRGEKRKATYGQLDTYHWKVFLCERISAVMGEKGSLTVFGDRPETHRLLIDHLRAESCTPTFGHGRSLWEWKCDPGVDNHWFDTLASNCAAASMVGSTLPGSVVSVQPVKSQSFSELQKQAKLRARNQ